MVHFFPISSHYWRRSIKSGQVVWCISGPERYKDVWAHGMGKIPIIWAPKMMGISIYIYTYTMYTYIGWVNSMIMWYLVISWDESETDWDSLVGWASGPDPWRFAEGRRYHNHGNKRLFYLYVYYCYSNLIYNIIYNRIYRQVYVLSKL